MSKPVEIVVAIDHANGIGKAGGIPWQIPEDMKHFKDITTTTDSPETINAVIMGRKTWESIPDKYRPLPARLNLVVTRSRFSISGANYVGSFQGAIACANDDPQVEKIFIIGGGEIYALAMPLVTALNITHIHREFDCDVVLPTVPEEFKLVDAGDIQHSNDIPFHYLRYERVKSQ